MTDVPPAHVDDPTPSPQPIVRRSQALLDRTQQYQLQMQDMTGSAFDALPPQHKLFVMHFMETFNASKAAILAGYRQVKRGSAGYALTSKPSVAKAIEEQMGKLGITEQRIKSEIAAIAFDQDITDFEPHTEEGVSLKKLRAKGVNTKLIKSVERTPGEHGMRRKVELYDKMKALELLGRVAAMFHDKQEIIGGTGGTNIIVVSNIPRPPTQIVGNEVKSLPGPVLDVQVEPVQAVTVAPPPQVTTKAHEKVSNNDDDI
jgi:phage terminase small subunit